MKRLMMVLSILMMMSLVVSSAVFSSDENIAKGCSVSVSKPASYGVGDRSPMTLTDGVYSSAGLWNNKNLIGWETKGPVAITIDLNSDQPISGVSFDAISTNGDWVQWPGSIMVFTSPDSVVWHYDGDLVAMPHKNGEPPMKGFASYRFTAHGLRTHGRFVQFIVFPHMESFFCDEIEVYKGSENSQAASVSTSLLSNPMADALHMYFNSRVQYRLNSDAKAVRDAVLRSNVSQEQKSALESKLNDIEKRIPSVHMENSPAFKAVLPLNDVDAEIFSVYGSLLKDAGVPSLLAWKMNRYDLPPLTGVPERKSSKAKISITMMKNEYREDSVLLTNASNAPVDAHLTVKGLPGGAKPGWLSVYAIPWTDTDLGTPIAAALVPAKYENGQFVVRIPAGMTSKIWLTVDSSKLQPGQYKGKLTADVPGKSISLPFNLYVSSVSMSRPRLSFTEWDYTFYPGVYAITPKNIDAAVDMMRSHFVDSPWARPTDIKLPGADAFDAQGNLIKPLSFSDFDNWLKRWNGARHYLLYLNSPTSFAGTEMGTKEFDVRVGSWAKALGDHMRSIGLDPDRLSIMIRDEPGPDDLKVIVAWAKPIKDAIPGITIFQDCNNADAYESDVEKQAQELADISCPQLPTYYEGGKGIQSFFSKLQAANHQMWFYQCNGPSHLLDPYEYNRLEAWQCFKYGATGMGLWAFADTGVFKNSWNEYTSAGPSYAPVFFFGDQIVDGVQYEGVREGIEDYEYLSMLKDAAQQSKDAAFKARADRLLKQAVDSVLDGNYVSTAKSWTLKDNRSKADTYRLRVLRLLERAD